jgi:hypothetical protein
VSSRRWRRAVDNDSDRRQRVVGRLLFVVLAVVITGCAQGYEITRS